MDRRKQQIHEYLFDPDRITEQSPREVSIDLRKELRILGGIFV